MQAIRLLVKPLDRVVCFYTLISFYLSKWFEVEECYLFGLIC